MSVRTLIVDGDGDGRTLVGAVLRDAMPGIRIVEVADAVAFSSALEHQDLRLAVVARDLDWADGLEVIRMVRHRHPGCAAILLGPLPENQTDPDTQPDAHLARTTAGLARLGPLTLRALERRSRARQEASVTGALNGLPVAVIELSTDERILSVNARAAALFGAPDPRALVGRTLAEQVSVAGEDRRGAPAAFIAATAASVPEGVAVLVRPITGAAVDCRLLVRAETRRDRLAGFTAALVPERTGREGRMDELLYAVSHDLQQPLATTRRSAQMLADRLYAQARLDGQEERMLRRILSGTERMETLMSGLLDYVRTGQNPVVRERVDLGQLCGEVVRAMQSRLEECGGVIRFGDLPAIEASRDEITRLMENLIGNAVKFHGSDKPVVDIECADRGDSWVLSVRDNGIGVDETQVERIFQPFQRLHTESEYPGTGIGLAVCRQICERHAGRIWVTSNPEGGSTFFASIGKNANA